MKPCITCKIEKDDLEFPTGKNRCKDCLKQYRKAYYQNNKIELDKQNKIFYQNNKESILDYQKDYYNSINGRIKSIFNNAKNRSKNKNLDFDLTKEWILSKLEEQSNRCILTNIEFILENTESTQLNPFSPSLDRIDSTKGYTQDNVRLVCAAINLALNEFGEEIFEKISRAYLDNISLNTQ